jgi:hypothetical protein
MEAWTSTATDIAGRIQEVRTACKSWLALSPFFATRGYHLYNFTSLHQGAVPPAHPQHTPTGANTGNPYPYARTIAEEDSHLAFPFVMVRLEFFYAFEFEHAELKLSLRH